MSDVQSIREIVSSYFAPLIAPKDKAQSGKSVGILVGVTIEGARYYFPFGDVGLQSGGSGVKIEDTVLFIGSNTKVFTGTMLALADVTQASTIPIRCDTDVADLLPSGTTINLYKDVPIKLWHLATHSAGFPDGVCGNHTFGNYPFSEMQNFLDKFQPSYPPGEYWVYSNQAFSLLGDLLSHAYAGGDSSTWDSTYQSWPSYIMDLVVTPLGMPTTQVDYSAVINQVAQGYNFVAKGQPYQPAKLPNWVMTSAGLGAGALSSTLHDMLTFLETQITPPKTTLGAAITKTQQSFGLTLSMGLGWQIAYDYFDKNGGLGGYDSYMAFDPLAKTAVVVLGNTDGAGAGDELVIAGRKVLGALSKTKLGPSVFPAPKTTPQCPE